MPVSTHARELITHCEHAQTTFRSNTRDFDNSEQCGLLTCSHNQTELRVIMIGTQRDFGVSLDKLIAPIDNTISHQSVGHKEERLDYVHEISSNPRHIAKTCARVNPPRTLFPRCPVVTSDGEI